jgi:hypothetical protein
MGAVLRALPAREFRRPPSSTRVFRLLGLPWKPGAPGTPDPLALAGHSIEAMETRPKEEEDGVVKQLHTIGERWEN